MLPGDSPLSTMAAGHFAATPGVGAGSSYRPPGVCACARDIRWSGGDGAPARPLGGVSAGFLLVRMSPIVPPYRTDRTRLHNIDVAAHLLREPQCSRCGDSCSERNFCPRPAVAGATLQLPNDELMKAPVRGAVAPLVPQKESFLGGSICNSRQGCPASCLGNVSARGGAADSAAPVSPFRSASAGPCGSSRPAA